jgi:hypothetical protein
MPRLPLSFREVPTPVRLANWILLGAVAVWVVGFLVPRIERLQTLSAELDRTLVLASERRQLMRASQQIMAAHEQQRGSEEWVNGEERGVSKLLRIVSQKGERQGVGVVRMNPGRSRGAGDAALAGAELELKSGLEPLVRYLYDIERGNEPLVVSYLNLRVPPGDERQLEARLTVSRDVP